MSKKVWIDPSGLEIPASRVTPEEKKKERVIERCNKVALDAFKKLEEARNTIYEMVNELLAESAHYASLEKWKGNATITNFSGTLRIRKEMRDVVQPNDDIHICNQIVNECLNKWKKGSNVKLQAVVENAFKTNKKGDYSVSRLITLRASKVDDDRWNEAMRYLDKCLVVVSSKAYFTIEHKDEMGEWHRIPLNFHEIVPEAVKKASKTNTETKEAA